MKRLMTKLKNQMAFSLAETLLAVLIMLFVSMIMAAGIPAAKTAYEKVVVGANSRAMLSTAVTALHDEIGTAWDVKDASTTSITYFKAGTGAKSMISLDDGKSIQVQDYIPLNEEGDLIHASDATQGIARHLVPDEGTASTLYVTYEEVDYDEENGIVTITGLKACSKSDDTVMATFQGESLQIRVISYKVTKT